MSAVVPFTQIFVYVTLWRPFEARLDQLSAFLSESSTLFVFILSTLFVFDLTPTASEYIETVGVWTIFSAMACSGVLSVIRSGLLVVAMVAKYRKKAQERTMITRDQVSTMFVEEPTFIVGSDEHKARKDFIVD